ncbi:hypothetical protein H9L13_10390 [Sphingomonas lutea]|uniref:Uncharacterized protein n=1 Tax=Sphingomonas lutea TaxID=1045317 RepID=A0A7G9SGQ9_9SPHN|nr:hypothetical protein [Sphingomonas lutea]QNN67034.1 hypothetical protein H9L13_10390 [Sphingomonas lutea]
MEGQPSIIRFSLDRVPERERRETLTEVFGRGVVNMEFTPLDDNPIFEFEIRLLPGLAITWGRGSPHLGITGHDRSLENDDLMLACGPGTLRMDAWCTGMRRSGATEPARSRPAPNR